MDFKKGPDLLHDVQYVLSGYGILDFLGKID